MLENQDIERLRLANLELLQESQKQHGTAIQEIRSSLPLLIENAVLKGLKQQQTECPAIKALPGLLQAVGELKGRTDEITGTFAIPDEITKRIRNAPGRTSIIPEFAKSSTFKWVVGVIVAAILSALGITGAVSQDTQSADTGQADTDDVGPTTLSHR